MGASSPNQQYKAMSANIKKCRDVSEGQDALRHKNYLPQYKGETTDGYNTRMSMSYLNNKFMDKIGESVGLILGNKIKYKGDNYITRDVDADGSTLDQFAQETLKNGEIDGHSFILVDSPIYAPENLQDQESNNIHPYWINIKSSSVRSWKIKNNILVQVSILETIEKDVVGDEFEVEFVNQTKVYKLLGGKVYYKIYDEENKLTQELTLTNFIEIPLVPFYANRISNMVSTPPFLNIANLNINTFQLGSQKQRALRIIGDPDKAIFDDTILQHTMNSVTDDGGAKKTTLTFGADIAQVFGTDARYEFVEPTGKGVELLGKEITQIELSMDGLGAEIVDKTNITATEAEISNTKATAADIMFSNNLEDALNKAYEITMQVDTALKEEPILLDRSFAKRELGVQTIAALNSMVLSGNLSKESLIRSISSGTLPTFITEEDIEEELARIDEENAGI